MPEPSPSYPYVHLHPGKEKSLLRGHPWVFSGAIQRIEVDDAAPSPGDWVCVMSSQGQALGWGHWGAGSIAVRLVASGTLNAPPQADWWEER
ncbi:MAG TPA: RlmI/RlmK family 23S rRNA methyltransferase, partial [Flavobacteriales bacterium]|nr:RlmI/RlmK family 23S rRNA methyltransferase [Flavobacteriales bacterium]